MRNIVNYIAFPLVDIETKKVKEVLYFIDTDLQAQRKMIADLDRESYLAFLENDYKKRMIAEYGDETGYFGRVASQEEIAAAENGLLGSGAINNRAEEIMQDGKIME